MYALPAPLGTGTAGTAFTMSALVRLPPKLYVNADIPLVDKVCECCVDFAFGVGMPPARLPYHPKR